MLGDGRHRRQCEPISIWEGFAADIGFNGVGQTVDRRVCGDTGGLGRREGPIDQCRRCNRGETAEVVLLNLLRIRDDAPTGKF